VRAGAARTCWCGNAALEPFDSRYAECKDCGTLVYAGPLDTATLAVQPDDSGYYGKSYWLEHQQDDLGQSDIHARARSDLAGRNLPWLRALLRYRLPPAQVLELGCAHGSFVALLNLLGYAASGVEMSPWVVAYGRATFGVPVALGPLETLERPAASLDVIVLMDVLEHLPDPLATLRRCFELLRPDGIVYLQTPCFPEGRSFAQLEAARDPFLDMLIPQEHLYLFSRRSVTELLRRLGAVHLAFEPAVFAQYDMSLVASRAPLSVNDDAAVEQALLQTPPRRLGLALLDLQRTLEATQADSALRLEQVHALTAMVRMAEADSLARARRIDELQALVASRHPLLHALAALRRQLRAPAAGAVPADRPGAGSDGPAPTVIAVDLTPVLPGGENGGAKIFVLELLRQLAQLAPQTQFILLTHERSHAELAGLDAANVRRLQVVGGPEGAAAPPPAPATPDDSAPEEGSGGALRQRIARLRLLQAALTARLLGALRSRLPQPLLDPLLDLRDRWRLARMRGRGMSLLHDLDVDLLFCPFTAPSYWEPGIATVCTIYDLQYKTYPQFFSAADVAQRDRTFRDACRRSAMLAAISEYSRGSALEHGRLDPARIRTIHLRMAQRMAPGPAQPAEVLAPLGLAAQRYLLFPANFWRHKNHEMLLTAFGMACAAGLPADIRLVCTGAPGERQAWLARAVRQMGLEARVVFPGFLPTEHLAVLMRSCLGLVFPSLYEGFGLPVIEAMAAGIPVACSDTTSLPEVAADAALLFDPRLPAAIAEALTALATDAALRQRLVEAGRERAAAFADATRMAREYWSLFQQALAIRSKGARRT